MEKAARAADNVVFAFDGDDAGRAAAWRALEGIIPALRDGKSVSFLFLPAGEDPDSFIQKKGAAAFETLLGGAKSLGEYAAERLLENAGAETDEGRRSAAARGAAVLLARVRGERAPFLRDILRRTFAERIGLDEKLLTREAARTAEGGGVGGAGGVGVGRTERMDARRRGGFRMRPEGLLFSVLCCLHARPELGLLLEESPPLLGSAGEAEAVESALSRLRFRASDGEDSEGEAEGGESGEGGEMNVARWLEEDGFTGVARQVRESRRYADGGADPEEDFHHALRSLERRHTEKTGAGKSAWLEKIRHDAEEDYEIPPLDAN